MNTELTLQKIEQMKFFGFARAYKQSMDAGMSRKITSDELIAHLVQAEWDERYNRKLNRLITQAKFRYKASFEEIKYRSDRNLDKNQFLRFSTCDWIKKHQSILISGSTGVGKSFIASALGYQACFNGFKVQYFNCSKFFEKFRIAKADGTYTKEIDKLAKIDLLIIDDFGLKVIDTNQRLVLLEVIEDRHAKMSTIISSQLPVDKWYEVIGEPTIADAILDRVVHSSYRVEIQGDSMRKLEAKQSKSS